MRSKITAICSRTPCGKRALLEILRVPWAEQGWRRSLRALRGTIAGRDGDWALLQYTGLSWSHKGFPIRLPFLLGSLNALG